MSNKKRRGASSADLLGPVLFVAGSFAGILVLMTLFKGLPAESASGTSAVARRIVVSVGRAPALLVALVATVLGIRAFLSGEFGRTGRHLSGTAGTAAGLAVLLGAFSETAGGRLGASTGGALAGVISVVPAAVLGLVTVAAPVWFTWLRDSGLFARRSGPFAAVAADQGTQGADIAVRDAGVSPEEADALLPEPPAEEPADELGAPVPLDSAPNPADPFAHDPDWSLPTTPAQPYPEDVRLRGQVPEGAVPIPSDDHGTSADPDEPPSSVYRWTPDRSGRAEDAAGDDLAAEGVRAEALDAPRETAGDELVEPRASLAEAVAEARPLPGGASAIEVTTPRPSWESEEEDLLADGAPEASAEGEGWELRPLEAEEAEELAAELEEEPEESAEDEDDLEDAAELEEEDWEEVEDSEEELEAEELAAELEEEPEEAAEDEDDLEDAAELEEEDWEEVEDSEEELEELEEDEEYEYIEVLDENEELGDDEEWEYVYVDEDGEVVAELGDAEVIEEEDEAPAEPVAAVEDPEGDGSPVAEVGATDTTEPETEAERYEREFAELLETEGAAEGEPASAEPVPAPAAAAEEAAPPVEPASASVEEPSVAEEPSVEEAPVAAPTAARSRADEVQMDLFGGGEEPDEASIPAETEPVVELEPQPRRTLEPTAQAMRAADLILEESRVAVSMLQRTLGLDFEGSCNVLDELQDLGFIGPYIDGKRRDILMSREEWLEAVGAQE
jgi:hypothetical protein